MTDLYDDHLRYEGCPFVELDRVHDMVERELRPELKDTRIVPSSSNNGAYLVHKISVLDVPFEEADIAEDRIESYVFSCSDFYFNQSDGIEADRKPSDMGTCKHCSVYKTVRAEQDENQDTLL